MPEQLSDWPLLQEVVDRWAKRDVLSAKDFYALADEIKGRAFTAKRLWDQHALEQTLESLEKALAEGKTLRDWRQTSWQNLAERFGAPGANVSHYVDTVFRTNTQAAYAAGRYAEMFDPDWMEASPYWMYSSIHDGRTRPAHKALDGKVFLKSDPEARKYLPPISFNCRCMAVEMALEDVEAGGYTVTPGSEIKRIPLVDSKGKPLIDRLTGKPLLVGDPPKGWNTDRVESLVPEVMKNREVDIYSGRIESPGEPYAAVMREQPVSKGGILPPSGLLPPMPVFHPPSPPAFRFPGELRRVSKELRGLTDHEEAVVFGPTGLTDLRYVGPKGPPFAIEIPRADWPKLQGTELLHNHPSKGPLSLADLTERRDAYEGDLVIAHDLSLGGIMATGHRWGQHVVSRVVQPDDGWRDLWWSLSRISLAEFEVEETAWSKEYQKWIKSLRTKNLRDRAGTEYKILLRWIQFEAVCERLKIPCDILTLP